MRSLERSALVEAYEHLTRALAQIAKLPSTPALRREEIKLQIALVKPAHSRQRLCCAGNEGRCGAGKSADSTGGSAWRASRRPPSAIFGPLWYMGRERGGVSMVTWSAILPQQYLALAEKRGMLIPLMVGHRLVGTSLLYTGDFVRRANAS